MINEKTFEQALLKELRLVGYGGQSRDDIHWDYSVAYHLREVGSFRFSVEGQPVTVYLDDLVEHEDGNYATHLRVVLKVVPDNGDVLWFMATGLERSFAYETEWYSGLTQVEPYEKIVQDWKAV